jgi:hypothetical protein
MYAALVHTMHSSASVEITAGVLTGRKALHATPLCVLLPLLLLLLLLPLLLLLLLLQIEAICVKQLEAWAAAGNAVDLRAEGKVMGGRTYLITVTYSYIHNTV